MTEEAKIAQKRVEDLQAEIEELKNKHDLQLQNVGMDLLKVKFEYYRLGGTTL